MKEKTLYSHRKSPFSGHRFGPHFAHALYKVRVSYVTSQYCTEQTYIQTDTSGPKITFERASLRCYTGSTRTTLVVGSISRDDMRVFRRYPGHTNGEVHTRRGPKMLGGAIARGCWLQWYGEGWCNFLE